VPTFLSRRHGRGLIFMVLSSTLVAFKTLFETDMEISKVYCIIRPTLHALRYLRFSAFVNPENRPNFWFSVTN